MIKSFKHKGLRKFFLTGNASGIQSDHAERIRMRLAALDTARRIEDMEIPGFRLHPLKGKRKGSWAIDVSGNWRITFGFADGEFIDVDYEDYH